MKIYLSGGSNTFMPENSKPKPSRPAQNAPGSIKPEPRVKQSAEAQNQRPGKKNPPTPGQARQKSAPKPSVPGTQAQQPRSAGKQVSGQQRTPRPAASSMKPATTHKAKPAPGHLPAGRQQTGSARLKVIPLGGMREIGKNMTVYEYGDEMIIVDCGIAFPAEDMPGIDVVIPDFSYVINNRQKLKGIFITHGHEDHIGALPYLLKDIKVPVYANHLTIELISRKIEDRGTGVKNAQLIKVSDGDVIGVGTFSVEFIHVNHSIEDANALAIRTPAGIIYHSGDFKIDHTPIHGKPMDLTRIGAIGDEGVLLMVCESTNIEKKGYTPSERKVGDSLAELFGKAEGRIFVTTFSSNVSRVQQIFTAAERYNRKVALIGRSMVNVFEAANSLGYIDMQPDTLIDVNQIDRYPADKLVLITTGSQGEPM
ncbi:MAG: MBL fold metallo-hydrolase, partial [Clostridia bacterium]|nr:MBL fold metallo-hydrolase [Clostridia bacterium]